MFTKIKNFLSYIFQESTYSSELERYIVAHAPKSVYDVEKLTQEFDKHQIKGL